MELNRQGRLYSSYCNKGERLNSFLQKGKLGGFLGAGWICGKVLTDVSRRLISVRCGAHWVTPEFASVFSVIRPSVFASHCPSKLTLTLTLHRDQEPGGLLPPWVFTFQRHGSLVLQKDIFWVLNWQEVGEDLHHFKGAEKEFISRSFIN